MNTGIASRIPLPHINTSTSSLDGKGTQSVFTQTQPSETGQSMINLKYKLMHWRSEANIYLIYI